MSNNMYTNYHFERTIMYNVKGQLNNESLNRTVLCAHFNTGDVYNWLIRLITRVNEEITQTVLHQIKDRVQAVYNSHRMTEEVRQYGHLLMTFNITHGERGEVNPLAEKGIRMSLRAIQSKAQNDAEGQDRTARQVRYA